MTTPEKSIDEMPVAVEMQGEKHYGSILLGGQVCRIITEAEHLRGLLDEANRRIAELEGKKP